MARIELVTRIEMPVERAFDLARDIGAHERSLAGTGERAVAGRTSGLIGPGETVTFQARQIGIRWRLTSRVVEDGWDPPNRFVDEQVTGPFRWFRHDHQFEPEVAGTRMTDTWEHELWWGPVGRLIDLLVVGRLVRRLLAQRADALALMAARPRERQLSRGSSRRREAAAPRSAGGPGERGGGVGVPRPVLVCGTTAHVRRPDDGGPEFGGRPRMPSGSTPADHVGMVGQVGAADTLRPRGRPAKGDDVRKG